MDKLLEQLQSDQHITADQARVLHIESVKTNRAMRHIVSTTNLVPEHVLDQYQNGSSRIELTAEEFVPDSQALEWLGEDIARKHNVLPVTFNAGECVLVLALDDSSGLISKDRLRREIPSHINLDFRITSATELKRCIDKCYGACHSLDGILLELQQLCITSDHQANGSHTAVVRLLDAILQDAVTRRASDIHLSPEKPFVQVRYRIDGVLCVACHLHVSYWPAMLVRIKVLSGIDIAETRIAQDGHMTRTIHGQPIDFRAASFPVRGGENVVLRVLDRRRGIRSLKSICGDDAVIRSIRLMIGQSHGLVVVCGPTGSGKTTTLYAILQSLDTRKLNIMTLEDPIEYPMSNIRQTRVLGSAAFGFAEGIKGVLRQDPDVILIGEIRDRDSCLMACRAAMTGHLVLTSTHAEDCVGVIGRLIDLGASRSVLASVLSGVLSQRLLRKRCTHCDQPQSDCGVCGGVGYSGRLALFECLLLSAELQSLLHDAASPEQLRAQAKNDGFQSLEMQAESLMRNGVTTAEEITRVLGCIKS